MMMIMTYILYYDLYHSHINTGSLRFVYISCTSIPQRKFSNIMMSLSITLNFKQTWWTPDMTHAEVTKVSPCVINIQVKPARSCHRLRNRADRKSLFFVLCLGFLTPFATYTFFFRSKVFYKAKETTSHNPSRFIACVTQILCLWKGKFLNVKVYATIVRRNRCMLRNKYLAKLLFSIKMLQARCSFFLNALCNSGHSRCATCRPRGETDFLPNIHLFASSCSSNRDVI